MPGSRAGRGLIAALAVAVVMLALPASGFAAVTFGNDLDDQPANSGECEGLPTPCTFVEFITPGPGGDNATGAPADGVITKFRIRAHGGGDGVDGTLAATITFRLATATVPDPGNPSQVLAQAVTTGPTVTIPAVADASGDTPINEFPAQVPVKKGQYLAIDGTNVQATHNSNSDEHTFIYSPALQNGEGPRAPTDDSNELLLNADIEPDADGDGFGDETQDQCPTQATNQGACDTSKPGLSGVSLTSGSIKYTLSEAAKLTFKLQKGRKGRKVRGKCKKPTRKNATKRKCTRYKTVKNLSQDGAAGANTLPIPGKKLGAGKYRLLITATDPHGNVTNTTLKFTIKKKRRR